MTPLKTASPQLIEEINGHAKRMDAQVVSIEFHAAGKNWYALLRKEGFEDRFTSIQTIRNGNPFNKLRTSELKQKLTAYAKTLGAEVVGDGVQKSAFYVKAMKNGRVERIYGNYPQKNINPFKHLGGIEAEEYAQAFALKHGATVLGSKKDTNAKRTVWGFKHPISGEEKWLALKTTKRIKDLWRRGGANAKRTIDEYKNILYSKRQDVMVVGGEYHHKDSQLVFRCIAAGHEWQASANHVLGTSKNKGTGCPECAKLKSGQNQRHSHEDFLKNTAVHSPRLRVIGQYVNANTPIHVACKKCSYEFTPLPYNLLHDWGCPRCAKQAPTELKDLLAVLQKTPHIKVLTDLKPLIKTHPILGRQEIVSKHRLQLRCEKHQLNFHNTISHLITRQQTCRMCSTERNAKALTRSNDAFMAMMQQKHPTIEVLQCPEGNGKTRVQVRCRIDQHVWSPCKSSLNSGYGCPRCAGHIRTDADFKKDLKERYGDRYTPLEVYQSAHHKINVRCSEGHIWKADPMGLLSHKRPRGCPACSKNGGFDMTKPAVLYLIPMYSKEHGEILGYGISGVWEKRWDTHRLNLEKHGITYDSPIHYSFAKGVDALNAETAIGRNFPPLKTPLLIEGFKKEATYLNELPHLLKFLKQEHFLNSNGALNQ